MQHCLHRRISLQNKKKGCTVCPLLRWAVLNTLKMGRRRHRRNILTQNTALHPCCSTVHILGGILALRATFRLDSPQRAPGTPFLNALKIRRHTNYPSLARAKEPSGVKIAI